MSVLKARLLMVTLPACQWDVTLIKLQIGACRSRTIDAEICKDGCKRAVSACAVVEGRLEETSDSRTHCKLTAPGARVPRTQFSLQSRNPHCAFKARKMDAAALDDEQIAAQLHRELNGLTRRAARGSLPPLQPLRYAAVFIER